jgi:hypothetical protein
MLVAQRVVGNVISDGRLGSSMAERKNDMAPSASWFGLRTGQRAGAFECAHCSDTFQTAEQLRQHEVDCINDDMDTLEA